MELIENTNILVIGKGRFGYATVQGLENTVIKGTKPNISHVSTRECFKMNEHDLGEKFKPFKYIFFCGKQLAKNAKLVARAMYQKEKDIEFFDLSNPDPLIEKHDVYGAVNVFNEIKIIDIYGTCKVWKICNISHIDIAGAPESHFVEAYVYGGDELPEFQIPGLKWKRMPINHRDLDSEVSNRLLERAAIDRWYDGIILGLGILVYTFIYSLIRSHENWNGKNTTSMIPMYILDKAISWTSLWMMVVSPFAGNLLTLKAMYNRLSNHTLLDKFIFVLSIPILAWPIFEFIPGFICWIVFRNIYFGIVGKRTFSLYNNQDTNSGKKWLKASLVDMVSMKCETGVVGFVYAFIHSMIGPIITVKEYKKKWFQKDTGRLKGQHEIVIMCGGIAIALLLMVTLRSLFGHSSWIKLKPVYAYLSPIAIWISIAHVFMFGYTGWDSLFDPESKGGQPSVSWMSTMFAMGVLFINHLFAIAGTKSRLGKQHMWTHSVVNIAKTK